MRGTAPAVFAKSAQHGRAPELLTDHLLATRDAVRELRRRTGAVAAAAVVPTGLWPVAEIAALAHDLGKVARGFQDMLTGRTRSWGHRHELLSLGFLPELLSNADQRLWVASAVITHHRSLTEPALSGPGSSITAMYTGMTVDDLREDLGDIDDAAVGAMHAWLSGMLATPSGIGGTPAPSAAALVAAAHAELSRLRQQWRHPVDPGTGLAAVLLQGALTLADHLSSAHAALHQHQPIGTGLTDRLTRHFGTTDWLRPHQRDCGEVDGHLLLRSPTGSGKTEAGLLWAVRQVHALAEGTGAVPRVVFTLPYLASINAMATRLGELVGDPELIGVAHSRAASYHLAVASDTDDGPASHAAARKAVSRAAATSLFRETVRVATPYQLLRAALAGPAHAGTLLDLTNSVIILDELHAYDTTRLGYILASAALWDRLGCRIAVLSATLPTALADLVGATLHTPVTAVIGPAGPPRHRIRLHEHPLTHPVTVAEIGARLAADESVLVVANNVAHAQALYDVLAPPVRARHGEPAAVLLHSRFTRGDRNRIEQALTDRYRATRLPRPPGLVVATQVVEVSLDIDLDALYTAAAPLEALLQRFGRVNRRGKRPPADVVICPPGYGSRRGDRSGREYADGVYEAEPVRLGWQILTRHDGQPVDETAATGWLDEIYTSGWGRTWHTEVERARHRFTTDFLTFDMPFAGREHLEDRFDALFNGTDAILARHRDSYADLLTEHPDRAGRLLGEQYLIPLPDWANGIATYDKHLRVRVIDGDYDDERGLLAVRPVAGTAVYTPGEVL
ncbi:CRISPR-associated helicase Cas3' [Dactylosporangium roseum]|uniref:CRISPR-associated helicase Cas3 n=1 Tax=Dactylosporangium roseum TaxID=47989 RepID=A0ABY5ZCQ7_9ACTN|nr:CRISPR-associated helicase Cas3' [Dactylosporangium roseum]UWZ39439.1 CRISPR-associated helicase Cas3' [Dactylosporangium roseum]